MPNQYPYSTYEHSYSSQTAHFNPGFLYQSTGLAVLFVTNFAACTFYWLARLQSFDDSTWLGPLVYELNGVERYIISLYWSIVTFSTVGYG